MKIFIDTADVNEIRKANNLGLLDGVTTNPTLISRQNKPFMEAIKEICKIVNGPISVEAISLKYEGMLEEAKKYSKIHDNIVIKIALTEEGLKAVKTLNEEGIKTNVTLCFSPTQALLAAKAGATYISPFIGRLDDRSHPGMDLVYNIKQIYDNYGFNTEIIVASIRNPLHVLNAALSGADIATIPPAVIQKLIKHPLTDIGIKRFLADWEKVKDSSS